MLLLCFSFAVPSTTRSSLFNDVVWDWENIQSPLVKMLAGIRFLSRDVHKCNRLFLDSNKEGILSIALWELFRINQIAPHCPFHESSFLILHWLGCRHYFVADRLEVLVFEDDSRSSSRVREHGSFLLVSQLHGNPDTLKSMSVSSRCVNKPMDCSLSTGLPPFLHDLRLWFRLRSLSWSTRSTDKLVLSQAK